MNAGSLFFVVCALLVLIGALGVVVARSPIRSALGLLVAVLGMAGIYLLLHAELLAALQVIVYAGAVVVLFVFVIMLIGPDPGPAPDVDRSRTARLFGSALWLGFVGLLLGALGSGVRPIAFGPAPVEHGTVEAVGLSLFSRGLVPFELVTVLLVVAIVAALALARGRTTEERGPLATEGDDASARMYAPRGTPPGRQDDAP
jgi:NADH-quinone oxidoreductase subunit J